MKRLPLSEANSRFRIVHHFPYAAIDTLPPCTFVDTGAHAIPACFRGLNQNAVNHTVAPAAVVLGNTTCTAVLLVFPSNFHADISAGGTAPQN